MTETENVSSELDEILKLAVAVREQLTIKPGPLENSLLGFYSVAQRLNREDDMSFSAKELVGYPVGDNLPVYRSKVFRNFKSHDGILDIDRELSHGRMRDGVTKLENLVAAKEDYSIRPSEKTLSELKKIKPESHWFNGIIPWSELARVLSGTKLEMISRLNTMIGEIAYGKIPQGIFKKFQDEVNSKLVQSNPDAVNALEIAYESLGMSENPQRIATVAFACRRLVKSVADELMPPQNGAKCVLKNGNEVEIGEERFLNRLEVFVDSFSSPNRKYLLKEVSLLRDLMNEIPESMSRGIHLEISNEGAERLVLKSYIILGSIILEGEKLESVQQSGT